ncbi:hypothetical protein ASE75_05940 [Sphingomonas sp. Leaf17]|uniref:hypothetical protein n=1 Tax=Sphingomonas sp. Leaf17 TaxID=1735683 RepID=UPI0006FC22A0|nr:hypothetical protein [Sphingomonas sp. Leaf17]KQM65770.1 hypothetical protein ASE75_05940 [Sphingomonas sp. Leaf17]
MINDIQDFEFEISHDRRIQDWEWRDQPWRGRATYAAVAAARGGIPDGMSLADAFQDVFPQIARRAAEKVRAANGQIDEPVLIDEGDLAV